MPNQFKCNDATGISQDDRIRSFDAVYNYYYDNVIKNPQSKDNNFVAPTTTDWLHDNCSFSGCPSNMTPETAINSAFKTQVDNQVKITNKDLARYLNDCASKINLDKTTSLGYGTSTRNYDQTMTLRDTTYNNLLTDRSDLDRKMKEVLALQGSMVNEHQTYVDGSVYTTLLWTVMATSLVYYVFTKI